MRALLTLLCLLIAIAFAAWLEADRATRAWPNDWVSFCVDSTLGPRTAGTEAADPLAPPLTTGVGPLAPARPSPAPASPAAAFEARLRDLEARLDRARSKPRSEWLACAARQLESFRRELLWHRLAGPHPAPRMLDPLQVELAVERLLQPLHQVALRERTWLSGNPGDEELQRHLRGMRLLPAKVEPSEAASSPAKERVDRRGLVFTLRELDAKAAHALVATVRLGRATSVVGAGVLLLWILLTLWRQPSGVLVWLAPSWLAGVLAMVSLTLSAPMLRTIAVRMMAAAEDLVWWPLATAGMGFLAMKLARHDRWLGPALLGGPGLGRVGLNAHALVLLLAAAAVPRLVPDAARQSELWLIIASVGLALFAARNALLIAVTQRPSTEGWVTVLACGLGVIGMALWHEDRGSALLVTGLVTAWLIYFCPARISLSGIAGLTAVLLGWSALVQPTQELPDTGRPEQAAIAQHLAEPCQNLPGERVRLAACPQASENADVFKSLALARAGLQHDLWRGFGLVDLPGNGLAAERIADRVILQMPSDYVAALWVACFGMFGLLGLFAYAMVLFSLASGTLGSLDQPGHSPLQNLLVAVAAFGCLATALRLVVTAGGALAAIPLTGQSPGMTAFGGSAAAFFGGCLGMALAARTSSTFLSGDA